MAGIEAQRGDLLTARAVNSMERRLRSAAIASGAFGVRSTSAGRALDVDIPETIPVFLIRATEDDHLLGKQAVKFPNPIHPDEPPEWDVFTPMDDKFILRGEPWPGLTVADFEPFFLTDPTKVQPGEVAVEYRAPFFLPPEGAAHRQMKLMEVLADHLRCRPWDGETLGEIDFLVAKPWLLRRTPFDNGSRNGIAYVYHTHTTRTASRAAEEEDQIVIPRYVVGDVIYATHNPAGGTGVSVDEEVEGPPQQIPIVWLDDNRDSRAWAEQNLDDAV